MLIRMSNDNVIYHNLDETIFVVPTVGEESKFLISGRKTTQF